MSTDTPDQLQIPMDRTEAYHWANRQLLYSAGILFMSFLAVGLGYVATGNDRLILGLLGLAFWTIATVDLRAKTHDGYARRLLTPLYDSGRDNPYPWHAFDLEVVYKDE